jgi:signal transduction histidine kinase
MTPAVLIDRATAEQLRLEQELKAQNEELARTVRFAEQFVTLLAHDLRNPLSAITTAAGLLRHRGGADTVVKPAERILKNADRISRMVDQLLDFTCARLGKGIKLALRPSDLAEVCRVVIDGLEDERVELAVLGRSTGEWDSERLAQVVDILVSNALTYGQRGTPVMLQVDGREPQGVTLTVHNRGIIPPAVLPFLFEPREPRKEGASGLGLGLYISQQIALAHRGRLDVQSAEPSGTCFTLALPRKG